MSSCRRPTSGWHSAPPNGSSASTWARSTRMTPPTRTPSSRWTPTRTHSWKAWTRKYRTSWSVSTSSSYSSTSPIAWSSTPKSISVNTTSRISKNSPRSLTQIFNSSRSIPISIAKLPIIGSNARKAWPKKNTNLFSISGHRTLNSNLKLWKLLKNCAIQ